MPEIFQDETLETPASSEETHIRKEARRTGEEAAARARNLFEGFSTNGTIWQSDNAAHRAEAEVLHRHGLIDDAELAKRSTPPSREGIGIDRGLSIGM